MGKDKNMKRPKRPQTYETTFQGRKVRVTVPEAIDEGDLLTALKDNLSPQAITAIAAYLGSAVTKNEEVNRQVCWFRDQLIELVGGLDRYNQLSDELGF